MLGVFPVAPSNPTNPIVYLSSRTETEGTCTPYHRVLSANSLLRETSEHYSSLQRGVPKTFSAVYRIVQGHSKISCSRLTIAHSNSLHLPPAMEEFPFRAQSPAQHSTAKLTAPRPQGFSPTPSDINTLHHHLHHQGISHHDYGASSATDTDGLTDEDYGQHVDEIASSRSSVSSIPPSVAPDAFKSTPQTATPTKKGSYDRSASRSLSQDINKQRWNSPFRHASSVRRMQLRDEDEDYMRHSRPGSRISRNASPFSTRSFGAGSGSKRKGSRDMLSPHSAKVKKEFPLVLLHCSLLPPSIPLRVRPSDAALLQNVLPEEYWRRWESLADKITNDMEIHSRGVLIPHPKGDYELLEEKLLESLELVTPRLRSGHYFGIEDVAEADESESDLDSVKHGTKCQDCGKRVVQDPANDRVWEVKVFAANGLMRAGAWAAAWNEMEKVDVEISVWLPDDVRRDVEQKCLDMGYGPDYEMDHEHQESTEADARTREIYGDSADSQMRVDGLDMPGPAVECRPDQHYPESDLRYTCAQQHFGQYDALRRAWTTFTHDRRNVLIAVLSVAVLVFALGQSALSPAVHESSVSVTTQTVSPISSSMQCHESSASVITATAEKLSPTSVRNQDEVPVGVSEDKEPTEEASTVTTATMSPGGKEEPMEEEREGAGAEAKG